MYLPIGETEIEFDIRDSILRFLYLSEDNCLSLSLFLSILGFLCFFYLIVFKISKFEND